MVNNVVSNILSLSVKLHDGLFEDGHLLVDVGLLGVHALGFGLRLRKGVLEHHELLVETLLLSFNLVLLLLQFLFGLLAHAQLVVEVVRRLLFLASLVAHPGNFRLDLQNLVFLLMNQLLDSLEGLVTLLHAEKRLLPVLQQRLLGHDDPLDLDRCLLQSVPSGCGFFFLRDELRLVKGLLFIKALYFFIHYVDE